MGRIANFVQTRVFAFAPELKGYSVKSLGKDVSAGITVGIIALPLSLALAIATGVPPIVGLYTAGVAGFLAALFSGSPYSVSGPAAAMVPILAAIIKQYGMQQVPYITILAALFLAGFALLGIGKYIKKMPESVVLGFTAGVATVLFCGQLNSFLGLKGITAHESFLGKLGDTIRHLGTINIPTLIVGVLAIAIILAIPRIAYVKKIPATLISVVFVTLLVKMPFFHSVKTVQDVYGTLPLGMPEFNHFGFSMHSFANGDLWVAALKIAALISIETLLCAVVADRLTKTKHRPNQELFAQSVANLGTAFFGGIPATAVIARTGTIIKSGAASRIASALHAIIVLGFVVALAPLAASVPLTALGAVLLVTAVKIAEIKEIKHFIYTKSTLLCSVLLTTLLVTVVKDLTFGVGAGILLHLGFKAHGKLQGSRNQDGQLLLNEEEAV